VVQLDSTCTALPRHEPQRHLRAARERHAPRLDQVEAAFAAVHPRQHDAPLAEATTSLPMVHGCPDAERRRQLRARAGYQRPLAVADVHA
jgi:hypothetical protein